MVLKSQTFHFLLFTGIHLDVYLYIFNISSEDNSELNGLLFLISLIGVLYLLYVAFLPLKRFKAGFYILYFFLFVSQLLLCFMTFMLLLFTSA